MVTATSPIATTASDHRGMGDDGDPEVPARARRRAFSARYKLDILARYEALDGQGRGALLRREGLYTSSISEWRQQREQGALAGLSAPRGRPPKSPLESRLVRVERVNRRLREDLDKAHKVIEIQGKLSELLETLAAESEDAESKQTR